MTIRQLIAYLLQDNDIDDEIIVAYWDRNYFVDNLDLTDPHRLDPLWKEFVKTGQEKVNGNLDFTQTGYDLASDLEKLLKEKGEN
jgi:subtilase family serine protease